MNKTATYYQATILLLFFMEILKKNRRAVIIELPDDLAKPGTEIRFLPDEMPDYDYPGEIVAKIRTVEKVQVCTGVNTFGDDVEGYTSDPIFDDRYLIEFDLDEDSMIAAGFMYLDPAPLDDVLEVFTGIIESKQDYNEDREEYLEAIVLDNRERARSGRRLVRSIQKKEHIETNPFDQLSGLSTGKGFTLEIIGNPVIK